MSFPSPSHSSDANIATRHSSATPFTVLNQPVGKYFLTANDDLFTSTDVSLLSPTGRSSELVKRVVRANDDDCPEIWLTLDPVSNTVRMGTSVSCRPRPTDTGKEMEVASSTVHMIARNPFDQHTQTRTRQKWVDDIMSRGALGVATDTVGDKSVRGQIIALIPSIKDDETGLTEIESGIRRRVGMVHDYVVRPRLTSRNYYLVQGEVDPADPTQSTNGGMINNANDTNEIAYVEDPAGTLDITHNFRFTDDPSDHLSFRSQAFKDDIRSASTRKEWIDRVYNRGEVQKQIKSFYPNIEVGDPLFMSHVIQRTREGLGHLHDLKYFGDVDEATTE